MGPVSSVDVLAIATSTPTIYTRFSFRFICVAPSVHLLRQGSALLWCGGLAIRCGDGVLHELRHWLQRCCSGLGLVLLLHALVPVLAGECAPTSTVSSTAALTIPSLVPCVRPSLVASVCPSLVATAGPSLVASAGPSLVASIVPSQVPVRISIARLVAHPDDGRCSVPLKRMHFVIVPLVPTD